MENFRTTFSILPVGALSYDDGIMLCGSCFVENIGKKLENACFDVMINPAGVLFNPESLATNLEDIIENRQHTTDSLIFHNGLYHSLFHHSCFSQPDANACIQQINQTTTDAHHFLKRCNYLIITFGTAWIYRHKMRNVVVSGCHKIPQQQFDKQLMTVNEITQRFSDTIAKLSDFNPKLKIIFTISPVRHIKDGIVENQQSKATLILSVKQLTERFSNSIYFPAYELLMDDLRDYRFYASDMLHPSETAIEYIWKYFCETFFTQETQLAAIEAEKLYTAGQHRPFHADSAEHQKFLRQCQKKARQLALRFPNAKF